MKIKLRSVATVALIALTAGGCKKKTPAEGPTPEAAFPAGVDAGGQARADSLSLERERLARERDAREAASARARADLTEMIHFDYDSDDLTPRAQELLRAKAAILRDNPGVTLRVEGHADQRGSTEYNLALGQRRAEAVRDFLGGYGISADRVTTTSYGKERPLVEEDSETAYAQNRRAEFVMTGGELSAVPRDGR